MDHGPICDAELLWCFTYGAPEPDLLETFSDLTRRGVPWVIVPVPPDGWDPRLEGW